jgi:hypothetical protein
MALAIKILMVYSISYSWVYTTNTVLFETDGFLEKIPLFLKLFWTRRSRRKKERERAQVGIRVEEPNIFTYDNWDSRNLMGICMDMSIWPV